MRKSERETRAGFAAGPGRPPSPRSFRIQEAGGRPERRAGPVRAARPGNSSAGRPQPGSVAVGAGGERPPHVRAAGDEDAGPEERPHHHHHRARRRPDLLQREPAAARRRGLGHAGVGPRAGPTARLALDGSPPAERRGGGPRQRKPAATGLALPSLRGRASAHPGRARGAGSCAQWRLIRVGGGGWGPFAAARALFRGPHAAAARPVRAGVRSAREARSPLIRPGAGACRCGDTEIGAGPRPGPTHANAPSPPAAPSRRRTALQSPGKRESDLGERRGRRRGSWERGAGEWRGRDWGLERDTSLGPECGRESALHAKNH